MSKVFIKALIERKANGEYSVIASTASADRQGDSIIQSGWDTNNFKKNPVMLWAHDYSALPIAKATGVNVDNRGLVLDYEFAPAEGNPMAQQVKTLVDGGFLNAVSVGFIPLERNGSQITKMELLEVSFVPVPANPQALQLMMSKGITRETVEKFFEAKSEDITAAEEASKGAVADEITAEEMIEQKWANWDALCEIIGALWSVYFDENTPVESFGSLLTETVGLLTTLAGSPAADETEEQKTLKAAQIEQLNKNLAEIKSLLPKNPAARKGVIVLSALSKSTSNALLKEIAESLAESGTEVPAPVAAAAEEETVKVESGDEMRALLITRGLLRQKEAQPRSALEAVNGLIKEKRAVVSTAQ